VELIERLASSEEVEECAVRQLFRYAQGRRETGGDTCTLRTLKSEQNLAGVVIALATSDAFRYRPRVEP
jgi:hypothetical protein